MLTPLRTSKFKKDYKRVKRRGWDLNLLREIIELLCREEELPPNRIPHKLSGDYDGTWDLHIQGDWVLIYEIDEENEELILRRTGSHSDLF